MKLSCFFSLNFLPAILNEKQGEGGKSKLWWHKLLYSWQLKPPSVRGEPSPVLFSKSSIFPITWYQPLSLATAAALSCGLPCVIFIPNIHWDPLGHQYVQRRVWGTECYHLPHCKKKQFLLPIWVRRLQTLRTRFLSKSWVKELSCDQKFSSRLPLPSVWFREFMTQPAAWRRMAALLRESTPFVITISRQEAEEKNLGH